MPTFYSQKYLESLKAATIETDRLNNLAKPQRSFYGKAHIVDTLEDDKGTTIRGYHLISYSTAVASAYITVTSGHCLLNLSMQDIDDTATATTRRHLRAFAELAAQYAQDDIKRYHLNTCTVHVSASTKRTAGHILPLRNRPSSFAVTCRGNESGSNLADVVRGYVIRILKQYPMPSTIRKYEIAKECRSMFWGYDWYAHIVGDEDGQPLVERSAYYRL